MSLTYTYATLKTALQTWIENTDPEFVAQLDTIIALGELQLLRDLDLELFELEIPVSLTTSGYLPKPADAVAPRTLWYLDPLTQRVVIIEPRTYEYAIDYRLNAGPGNPKYMAEYTTQSWLISPVPSATIAAVLRYTKRPPGLSASVTTTWLSLKMADLLLYACLQNCEQYVKSDERIAVWKTKYNDLMGPAKVEVKRLWRAEYGR